MTMADWIHNYPGVAALLQQDMDILEQGSVEEPVLPARAPLWPGTMAWRETVVGWAHACITQYGPGIGLFAFVAPDIYRALYAETREDASVRPAQRRDGGSLLLCGAITVRSVRAYPVGTWALHWSQQGERPQYAEALSDVWSHTVLQPLALGEGDAASEAFLEVADCIAYAPALVCPCGAYLLRWPRAS